MKYVLLVGLLTSSLFGGKFKLPKISEHEIRRLIAKDDVDGLEVLLQGHGLRADYSFKYRSKDSPYRSLKDFALQKDAMKCLEFLNGTEKVNVKKQKQTSLQFKQASDYSNSQAERILAELLAGKKPTISSNKNNKNDLKPVQWEDAQYVAQSNDGAIRVALCLLNAGATISKSPSVNIIKNRDYQERIVFSF